MTMSKPQLTKELYLAALRAEGDAFRAALDGTPLDAPVPSRAGLRLGDLAWQLSQVYGWVGAHLARGVTDRPAERPDEALPAGVDPVAAWTDAFRQVAAALD